MKKIVLTGFIIFLSSLCTGTFAQRCGDGIWLAFKKNGNKFLDSADLKISLKTFDRRFKYYNAPGHKEMSLDTLSDTAAYITHVNELSTNLYANDSNKIYFSTLCGFFRMEFTFTMLSTGERTKLILYKVPHDIPLKLNEIILSAGVYEYNINGILDSATFKEDINGIYNFDFSNFNTKAK